MLKSTKYNTFPCVLFGTFNYSLYLCIRNQNNNKLKHRRQRVTAAKDYEDFHSSNENHQRKRQQREDNELQE